MSDDTKLKEKNTPALFGGQKGNRGRGRPKIIKNRLQREARQDVRELARCYSEEALHTLLEIMRDRGAPAATRVAACNHVLNRGLGLPTVQVDVTSKFDSWSEQELADFIFGTVSNAALTASAESDDTEEDDQ